MSIGRASAIKLGTFTGVAALAAAAHHFGLGEAAGWLETMLVMAARGSILGRKQEDAIAALLTQRNVEEAARAAGIGARTLLRWLKLPEFDTAYREARRKAFSQAIARLQQGSAAAATTLLKVMLDSATPASTRVRAAESILTHSAKAIEIEDIEARVEALEQAGRQRKAKTMKTVDGRLRRLETQFGIAGTAARHLIVLSDRETGPAENAYINIPEEAGFLPTTGVAMVDFRLIPRGLNAKETERFVRENGARICGSRAAQYPGAPDIEGEEKGLAHAS